MKQFPIIRASGSHYEVGTAIGKAMSSAIMTLLVRNKSLFGERYAKGIEQSKPFRHLARKLYPDYCDELRGIADGAQVSYEELFLTNNREVLDFDPTVIDPGHCTIVAIPTDAGYVLGHNEDWAADSIDLLYILDVTIDGEKIVGLNYANSLVGVSVAINNHGLIEAVNELSHNDSQLGVSKNFIARAILDCKTLEEVENLMHTIPRSAGYNHVLIQGKRLWNIESSAKEYVIEKTEIQKYVHTNHYLTELKRFDKGNKESEARYAKVRDLLSGINTVNDIKRVLSDREDPQICRSGTIGSVIFDMPNKVAHITYGQPTPEAYIEHSLTHLLD